MIIVIFPLVAFNIYSTVYCPLLCVCLKLVKLENTVKQN